MYYGVYKDYSKNKRILQVVNDVDSLSCEILAIPGIIHTQHSLTEAEINQLLANKKEILDFHKCDFLEINCTIAYVFANNKKIIEQNWN